MGSSTITLEAALDYVEAKGIPSPRAQVAGFGTDLAIMLANDVMNDLIAERFNWKWNRVSAPPFLTNSYQQDYPQIGLANIGWLEDGDWVDINNTGQLPKPGGNVAVVRQISRAFTQAGRGYSWFKPTICWMANSQLNYGVWPGANVVYSPLITTTVVQNPLMSMIDKNGNRMIVTTFGTTGSTAPFAAAAAPEGTVVTDGSVRWTVVSPDSQGFRIYPLPGPTGPVYQITPYYQKKAKQFVTLQDTLDPIPNDYATTFLRGLEFQCRGASPNPADQKIFLGGYPKWLDQLAKTRKQGDREADAYGMIPTSSPVDSYYGWARNPQDPSEPY